VTLRRRRWGFHYELQSGSLATLTPAYDVRVTIAASTGAGIARLEETCRHEQEACVRTSAAMRRRVLDAIVAGDAVDEPRGEI
jgi:hypothetical protein